MTNLPATQGSTAVALPRDELIHTLQNSLYPGASRQSVELVLSYCSARGLDPLRKPVHIVPMWDKNLKQMRDVIMPGIGQYRIDAARTQQYAGQGEPTFGPAITGRWGDVEVVYPEWCRVVVLRLVNGTPVEFVAVERWTENYATKEKGSAVPNSMWARRPYAQLSKCAEAQALRKAFPEEIGSEPTADETRTLLDDAAPPAATDHGFMPQEAEAKADEAKPEPQASKAPIDVDPATGEIKSAKPATEGMKASLKRALAAHGKTEEQMKAALGFDLAGLAFDTVNKALEWAKR